MASAVLEFPPVEPTPDGYSIMGAQFSGPFRQFLYSGGGNSLLYRLMDGGAAANEIKRQSERLLSLFLEDKSGFRPSRSPSDMMPCYPRQRETAAFRIPRAWMTRCH